MAHYAGVCNKRLERTSVNAKRQRLRKPTLEEIDLARLHIFRASMFGGTIEEVMALQKDRYGVEIQICLHINKCFALHEHFI